jgi:hypothetical protein
MIARSNKTIKQLSGCYEEIKTPSANDFFRPPKKQEKEFRWRKLTLDMVSNENPPVYIVPRQSAPHRSKQTKP